MVTITLFKNCDFNNGNKVSCFSDINEQKQYFTDYPVNDKMVLNDVKISSLSEPILLEKDITEIFEYTYGMIDYNDNKRIFYFSISSFEILRVNKTYMRIEIDYYETYRYPINNGNALHLGRGFISRFNRDLPYRKYRVYSPDYNITTVHKRLNDNANRRHTAILTYHDNVNDENYFFVLSTSYFGNLLDFNPQKISVLSPNFDINNIIGYWYSPIDIDDSIIESTDYIGEINGIDVYRIQLHNQGLFINSYIDYIPSFSEYYKIGITDGTGQLVYTLDDRFKDIQESLSLTLKLNVTLSTCRWMGYINHSNVTVDIEDMFTIVCEPLDLFSDTFTEYYIRERPFIEQERIIQREQSAIQGIANVGTSAINGAVAGSIAMPGIGTVAGAVGGAVSNLASVGIDYYTSDMYNKQYQIVEDARAKVQTDDLRSEGSSIYDMMLGITQPSIMKINIDESTYRNYESEIQTFGYYYQYEIVDIDDSFDFVDGDRITCNVDIENIPTAYGQNVSQRFIKGVEFIKPTW